VAGRRASGPPPRRSELAGAVEPGRGRVLRDGLDAVLFAYGPVLLHEALTASELLAEDGFGLAVVNMPWLNAVDTEWLGEAVEQQPHVLVLEDHSPVGGLADSFRRALDGRPVTAFGVEGWPACGTPGEALRHHGLDGASLAERIASVTRVRVP
jgi:transketolase